MSDPRVYDNLASPHVPFLLEHAEAYLAKMKAASDAIFQALEDSQQDEALITVGGSPTTAIREVQADGSDLLIGDMKIKPSDARARGFIKDYSREGEDDSPEKEVNAVEPVKDETEWNIGCEMRSFGAE
ncbi:hypothetical protein H1R20_g16287, partial [Candolleomyces eurysporus]